VNKGGNWRCSSVVCPFQLVWGAFYRQGRLVERVGPISQVRLDQGVQPAMWSTASCLGHPWSLLLRRLRVGSLGRFCPTRHLGGAAGPLGAAGPPPCHVMNLLRSGMPRIALEWWLWRLNGRTSGPIDPSDRYLLHSIKPMFPWWISFIQVVPAGEAVHWTRHECDALNF
jgi:hypothetical protein